MLVASLGAIQISRAAVSLSFLCCTFIFGGKLPRSVIHFCAVSRGFITGRREATRLHALRSVHERNTGCAVTSLNSPDRLWKKGRDWPLMRCVCCFLSAPRTEDQYYISCECSQLTPWSSWNLNQDVGGLNSSDWKLCKVMTAASWMNRWLNKWPLNYREIFVR